MSSFKDFNTKRSLQQPYLAKQLLPQSLLEELEEELDITQEGSRLDTKDSFKYLDQRMLNMNLGVCEHNLSQPKRKVYSQQNISSNYHANGNYPFMNPMMQHGPMMNSFNFQMPMCGGYNRPDNYYPDPYYYNDTRMFGGLGIPSTDSKCIDLTS
jgi:hypothetical protein